jgi:hypothetical protein
VAWGEEGGWGKAWDGAEEWAGAPPRLPRQPCLRLSLPIPEEEIATLKETTSELQRQLDEARWRLDELTAG